MTKFQEDQIRAMNDDELLVIRSRLQEDHDKISKQYRLIQHEIDRRRYKEK